MADTAGGGAPGLGCWGVEALAPAGLAPRRDPNDLLLAALYSAINEHPALAPGLKRRLHEEQPKSFSLSPLYLRGGDGVDRPVAALGGAPAGARLWFRWAGLEAGALDAARQVLARGQSGHPLTLGRDRVQITGWSALQPPRLAPVASYAELYARAEPAASLALRLTSPFAVRSSGQIVPVEQLAARHFFGGYRDRWCAFSPAEMADLPADRLLAAVRLLPPVDLRELARPSLPSKAPRRVYAGLVRFAVEDDEATQKRVAALANYAWYCGTGSGTAWGLGQTERV